LSFQTETKTIKKSKRTTITKKNLKTFDTFSHPFPHNQHFTKAIQILSKKNQIQISKTKKKHQHKICFTKKIGSFI